MLDRCYLVVTGRRLLWLNVVAAREPSRSTVEELAFSDVTWASEDTVAHRAFIKVRMADGTIMGLGFSRPETKAAVALREQLRTFLA